MPFLAQYSWSMASPLLTKAAPDTVCPSGTIKERQSIEDALAILSITNPEMYKDVTEAEDVFVVRFGDFSDSEWLDPTDFRLPAKGQRYFLMSLIYRSSSKALLVFISWSTMQ